MKSLKTKERLKGFISGILIGAICVGGTVLARTGTEAIEIAYSGIRVFMDGQEVEMKDANGQPIEPFIYNGTTYLPLRAVGNAIGKEVNWDGVEKVVYLGAKPGNVENWLDVCGPYQYSRGEEYRLTDNKYFTMSGKKYTNGFTLSTYYNGTSAPAEALFNLDGKYSSVTFTVGHIDGTKGIDHKLNVYIDGLIAYTMDLKYDDVAQKVTIPLNGALQMKLSLEGGVYDRTSFGFSEGKFE